MDWTLNTLFPVAGRGIAYSVSQTRWVAVGDGSNPIQTSTDGISWIAANTGIFTVGGRSVVYSPSINRWVAVGQGTNTIATSGDGITWIGLGTTIFSTEGVMAVFGNGLFITAGYNSAAQAWSSDGFNWTITPQTTFDMRQTAVYGRSQWLLGSTSPHVLQSSVDGKTVMNEATPNGLTEIDGITYNSGYGRYVAVGSGSSNIVYSSDGIDWYTCGRVFSNYGWKIATNNGGPPPGPPPIPITTDVINLMTNTSIINGTTPISINGNLTVFGDLIIKSTWILTASSMVNITGSLQIFGNTTFNALQPIECDRLTISSLPDGSVLEIILTVNLTMGASITYPLIKYNTYSGTFNTLTVRSAPNIISIANDCPVATQDYSSSTLTVTVTMTTCNPGNDNLAVVAMPTGMIVGIAVGSAVAAAGVILIVVFLMKKHLKKLDAQANSNIRKDALSDLQRESSGLRVSAGVNL